MFMYDAIVKKDEQKIKTLKEEIEKIRKIYET